MERRQLEAAAANYPYLQGLWAIPLGFGMILAGFSNLQNHPTGPLMLAIILGGLAIAAGVALLIGRYYRDHYGSVTPTRDRTIRQALAIGAWIAILAIGANENLFWSPDGPQLHLRLRVCTGDPGLLRDPRRPPAPPRDHLGRGLRRRPAADLGRPGRRS